MMSEEEDAMVSPSVTQNKKNPDMGLMDCTLPDPPSTVRAIGRHESAEIWWTKDYNVDKDSTPIIEWEIVKYRKDRKDGIVTWSNKGSMKLYQLGKIHQCVFFDLKDHCEYCFTVTVKTDEGYSAESQPSNMVYIDAPPPVGWKLFFDKSSKQYYYYNEFFRFSQVDRPEIDPYYLDNQVAKNFSRREIRNFKEVWIEEMLHFEKMTHIRLKDILLELGESVEALDIRNHMKAYAKSETEILTFKCFVDVLLKIKLDIIEASRRLIKKKEKPSRAPPSYTMGNWTAKFHKYSKKWRFTNPKALFNITDSWDMTWDARFYISEEDLYEVHEIFDFGMVERIRNQFDAVNVSNGGVISSEEFDMFLVAMDAVRWHDDKKKGIQISKLDISAKNSFFRKIDENNSGHITFNEFCLMMCMLLNKKHTGSIWKKIRQFDYLNVLAETGPINIPMPPSIYMEKLRKRKEKFELLQRIAKKKKEDEKELAKQNKIYKKKKSKRNRKIHYTVNDDESKGSDFDVATEDGIDVSPYVGSNYDDEELDELRALAPPKISKCLACLNLCCASYVENAMESLNITRSKGPHGVFCLCGCRSYGKKMQRDDFY